MSSVVTDVDTADFQTVVVDRSHEVPVVVDFWAAWCGPCRTLGPTLESAVQARGGEVELAKVDVDANQQLAQQFRVQGIPAVKAFRDGEVVAEFTGALNAAQVEAFLDQVVPSEADRLAAGAQRLAADDPAAARDGFERALEADPGHLHAALALAELVATDDPERATALATPHLPDPRAEAVLQQLSLAAGAGDLEQLSTHAEANQDDDEALLAYGRALAAAGLYDEAIEVLLAAVAVAGDQRDDARSALVDVFGVLGHDDERVRAARPRLAAAIY